MFRQHCSGCRLLVSAAHHAVRPCLDRGLAMSATTARRPAPPKTPLCHALDAQEWQQMLADPAYRSGTYFDGFNHSRRMGLAQALCWVHYDHHDAIFCLEGGTTLFLFHDSRPWLCRLPGTDCNGLNPPARLPSLERCKHLPPGKALNP